MIGRREEIAQLNRLYDSRESEFVAVYGRRRVGKTYLIREVFDGRFAFVHTGKSEGSLRIQLAHFHQSLTSFSKERLKKPRSWDEAFESLKRVVAACSELRKVVFIDELPWMDTPRSGFLSALDSFWNEWASARKDILLIVCGSAAAWMVKNLFRNRGSLHNRVTARICLMPFTLNECERYASERGLEMSRGELAECYMIFGGIPYYWRSLQQGLSLAQNIDRTVFAAAAALRHEFGELYRSLFRSSRIYERVVAVLARKKIGMTRSEIIAAAGGEIAGALSEVLESLECSGFIRRYRSPGKKARDSIYQLIDAFTLFHFKFLDGATADEHFWQTMAQSPARSAWRGLAFERLCLQHVRQIKSALGISGIHAECYAWRHEPDEAVPEGAQIDLLIERSDGVTNICEMKFGADRYVMDERTESELSRKLSVFQAVTKTRQALHLTLVTSFGLMRNKHSGRVQSEVTLDDLFQECRT